MAARVKKLRHDENTRGKIQASQLINRLSDHVLGTVDLKPTQVQAALGLLRKVMPDLSSSQVETTIKRDATDFTLAELVAIAKGGSEGSGQEADGPDQSDSVH